MPLIAFDSLPPDARVWVFAASRPLEAAEQAQLLTAVDAWLTQWKAHGAPLTTGRTMREAQFLAIGVDQRTAGASGCSIDALYRTLGDLERTLGTALVSGGRVFWRAADGTVQGGPRTAFGAAAQRGEVTTATPVFDTTVATRTAFVEAFEKPAAESWHAQLLP